MLLDHMQQQCAAGTLQLSSIEQAARIVRCAALAPRYADRERYLPLLRHAIAALEQLLGVARSGFRLSAVDESMLDGLISTSVRAARPAALAALLASRLPIDVPSHPEASVLLKTAATMWYGEPGAACVRLLHQAGAQPTTLHLYAAIDGLHAEAVAALIACGAPAPDVSEPTAWAFGRQCWSCPIQRALHQARDR